MNTTYDSFASWNPREEEFTYDKSLIEGQGFRLRARLDKRNPDLELLRSDFKRENKEVKLIDIEPENKLVDVWCKSTQQQSHRSGFSRDPSSPFP